MLSSIVPSYLIHVKRPHTFLRTIKTLREIGNLFFFLGGHRIGIAIGTALPKGDLVLQGVIGCLFSRAMPVNSASYM